MIISRVGTPRRLVAVLACSMMLILVGVSTAQASSLAVATGDSTVDGRPVMWKNRDHWSTPDGWQVRPYHYEPDGSTFGSGDRYGSRFAYTGITANGESGRDVHTGMTIPWSGSNDRGLGLTQVAGHTLTSDFTAGQGFPVSQDLDNGMSGGMFNHVVLSRAETVDEVEQIIRDTNDGGGYRASFARNTSTIISVFDRSGNAAIFEIDGNSFTRDNITEEPAQDAAHNDDKDASNPPDGDYSGYDWRNNFNRVTWTKPNGFPYLVDEQTTEVIDNEVVNTGGPPDGIDDRETSTSAVMRYPRAGIRMDDPFDKDYRYFIQRSVNSGGVPTEGTVETLSRSIGELPYSGEKPTGWHVNRFVSTFGFVAQGVSASDPYDGKLATIWVALGEPSVSVFVPIFPWAGETPAELDDMYLATNAKRHLVYDYTDDNSCGYSCGRNVDHTINLDALVGPGGYYGEGGIQQYTFGIENWAFAEYEAFMADLRTGNLTQAELRTAMINFQNRIATTARSHYEAGNVPG